MVFYFVQKGESLYTIAKRYQTTVHAIVAVNRLDDPNAICPGQALIIPRPGEVSSPPPGGIVHLVRAGETVFHLASRFATTPQEILRANQIAHPEFILPGQQLVIPEQSEAGDEWPMYGRTPGRGAGAPLAIRGSPVPLWSFRPRQRGRSLPSAPALKYDRVYAGLADGAYYALDAATGHLKWRFDPDGHTEAAPAGGPAAPDCLATPAVFDGIVYIGGPDGVAYALDAFRGTPIWKVRLGSVITSSPAVTGGLVYLATLDGQVHAMEAKTGARVWSRALAAPITAAVAVGDDKVFALDDAGTLQALHAQAGDLLWQVPAHAGSERARVQPVFAEVVVLVGSQALDPTDGSLIWTVDDAGGQPAVTGDSVLYDRGAVDLLSGDYRWQYAQPPPAVQFTVCRGAVLAAGSNLQAAALKDGRPLWHCALEAAALHPPAIAPGLAALSLADGGLRMLRLRSGSEGKGRESAEKGRL